MNKLNTIVRKTTNKVRKHSPEIMVVAGIVGTVTSAVMACKATIKAQEITEELKEDLKTVEEVSETRSEEEYSESDRRKDIAIIYTRTAVKYAKVYAPSIILGTLSISTILTGHNISRKRNIALAAAYATVDKGFKEYRNRVVERFGEEVEKELRYDIKAREYEETTVDSKGKEKTKTVKVKTTNYDGISDYAKFFDDGCTGWTKDPELNLLFLKRQQQTANEILQRKGHLYLNEVYDMLGIKRTKAGQIVGWIYDEENPIGDNYVDFGIYDTSRESVRNFVNGHERTILLDFNVDGNILDLM